MRKSLAYLFAVALVLCSFNRTDAGVVVVLDFNELSQGVTTDVFNGSVTVFDVTSFGFSNSDYNMVTNAVLNAVDDHYHTIPTVSQNGLSPIPDGMELDIDFVIGDIGVAPAGASEYYYIQIGSETANGFPLGWAGLSSMRNSSGDSDPFGRGNGHVFGSVWSNNINGLGGVGNALTSGNLAATVNALAGTISHEIGHGLSLGHVAKAGSVTHSGVPPLMGTGAIDLPNIDRISAREFSFSASNGSMNITQLVGAVGLRNIAAVPEPSSGLMFAVSIWAIAFRRRVRPAA